MGVLNLKEVINFRITCQLLTVEPQRAKLFIPVFKALTAESFDRGHCEGQTDTSMLVPELNQSNDPHISIIFLHNYLNYVCLVKQKYISCDFQFNVFLKCFFTLFSPCLNMFIS